MGPADSTTFWCRLLLAASLLVAGGCGAADFAGGGDGQDTEASTGRISSETGEDVVLRDRANSYFAQPWGTVITGSLSTGESYSISMKAKPLIEKEKSELWPIVTTIYTWSDGKETMILVVSDETAHTGWGDSADAQRVLAELIVLTYLPLGATTTSSTPIEYIPGPPETGLIGHELVVESSLGRSVVRAISKEQVSYAMISVNQSGEDTGKFFNSLAIAPYELRDLAAEAAADSESSALLAAAEPFTDPPYGEREMLPSSGGWEYRNAPPEGAEVPGMFPDLDALFVTCRDGDGESCDELYFAADDTDGAIAYRNFADTCGGRTITERCTDLLGGTASRADPIEEGVSAKFRRRNDVYILELIPPPTMAPPGTKPDLDPLWLQCGAQRDGAACDELRARGPDPGDEIYAAFGITCGGRRRVSGAGCEYAMGNKPVPPPGSPAPGLDAGLDELWVRCSREMSDSCTSLFFETGGVLDGVPKEEHDRFDSYFVWARTCGGVLDHPVTLFDCTDYLSWPIAGEG